MLRALLAAIILALSVGVTLRLVPRFAKPVPEASPREAEAVPTLPRAQPERPQELAVRLPEEHPLSAALCPDDMVWVGGHFCALPGAAEGECAVRTRRVATCMDRYEYPNQLQVVPAVMIHFFEASRLCKAEGKRLCSEWEWTHACREPLILSACNFGRAGPPSARLQDPARLAQEMARVEGRRPAGQSGCASPHRVFDLPGNVQEWVQSEPGAEYRAALKGGSYNQGSIGCERSIRVDELIQRSVFTGFRCCREPLLDPSGLFDPAKASKSGALQRPGRGRPPRAER